MQAVEKKQIEQYVEQLLNATEVPDEFPLPLEAIARSLGCSLHFFLPDLDVADTVVTFSHQKKLFYINQDCTSLQQYYAIARILGHIVIYGADQDYISVKQPSMHLHKECQLDYFARALLMPAAQFKEKWPQYDISQLAQFFAVSPALIRARAQDLALALQLV